MEILKYPDKKETPIAEQTYTLKCSCGCEFSAVRSEAIITERRPDGYTTFRCPLCGRSVKVKNRR